MGDWQDSSIRSVRNNLRGRRMSALAAAGCIFFSAFLAMMGNAVAAPPNAPINLEVTPGPGGGQITVSWDPPAGGDPATDYDVYGQAPQSLNAYDLGGSWNLVGSLAAPGTSLVDGNAPDTGRCYYVLAANGDGQGPPSNVACGYPHFSDRGSISGQIVVNVDPGANPIFVIAEHKTNPSLSSPPVNVTPQGSGPVPYNVTNLTSGDYRVIAWVETTNPGDPAPNPGEDQAPAGSEPTVSGDHVTGIDVTLDPIAPVSISGTLRLGPSGSWPGGSFDVIVNVLRTSDDGLAGSTTLNGPASAFQDGVAYSVTGLPPDEYNLSAFVDRNGNDAWDDGDEEENMTGPIDATGGSVTGLDLLVEESDPGGGDCCQYQWPTEFYGGTLWGNVTMSDGEPVAGLKLFVRPSGEGGGDDCNDEGGGGPTLRCFEMAETNGDGTYVFTHLKAGFFDLDVDGYDATVGGTPTPIPNQFIPAAFEVPSGASTSAVVAASPAERDFQFNYPAYIRGNVSGEGAGFLQDADVNVWSDTGWGNARTDAEGYFQIAVAPGSYGMGVQVNGFSSYSRHCFPGSPDCIVVSEAGDVVYVDDILLNTGTRIYGFVTDSEGNPVMAHVDAFQPFGGHGGFTRTDEPEPGQSTGWFNLTVEPGVYEVRIEPDAFHHSDLRAQKFTVDVSDGSDEDVGGGSPVVLGSGVRIRGNVTDPDGNKLGNLNIMVFRNTSTGGDGNFGDPFMFGFPEAFGFTNPDGSFTVNGLEPSGESDPVRYDVYAEPAFGSGGNYMRNKTTVTMGQSGTTWANVVLKAGGKITGFVLDGDGNPVVNAFVDAFWAPANAGQHAPGPGPGGEDGGDCFDCGGPGGPEGEGGLCSGPWEGGGEFTLSGTWTYEGTPGGDVTFIINPNEGDDDFCMIVEGATFSFENVPGGTHQLGGFIDLNGDGDLGLDEPFAFLPPEGEGEPQPLSATPWTISENTGGIHVQFLDPPPGGWDPMMLDGGGGGGGGECPECGPGGPGEGPGGGFEMPPDSGGWGNAQTDANGKYTVGGLATGKFGMFVNPPFGTDYSNAQEDPWMGGGVQVAVGNTTWKNFTLSKGGSLEVCVYGPDGTTPVQHAWVNAFSFTTGFGGGESTRTTGCATLRGLRTGTYEVQVEPPQFLNTDYTRATRSGVSIIEGESASISITLKAGVTFSGRVEDTNGNGVANAFIDLFKDTGPGGHGGPPIFGMSDGSGNFQLKGVDPGEYGMYVQPPFGSQYSGKFVSGIVVDDDGESGYTVVLGGGGWITGRVLDSEGNALANAFVGAWSPRSGSGNGGQTNSTGHFNITGLSGGSGYEMFVDPPFGRWDLAGHHEFPLTVTEGQGLDKGDIVLSTGGTLIGKVEDADGNAIRFAQIAVDGATTFGWGMTDSTGNFSIEGLSASDGDEFTVHVQPGRRASFAPTRVTVTWNDDNSDSIVDAGTITVSGGKNLTGRITKDGLGVNNAKVQVMPTLPYFGPPIGGVVTTAASGWYNLTGLPSGNYDVAVRPQDGTAGSFERAAVTITSGADTFHYNKSLGAGARLNVTVTSGGSAVAGAHVEVKNATLGAGGANSTDENGLATFKSLPAGAFKLKVFAPGYAPSALTVSLAAGSTTETTVTLTAETLRTISGSYSNSTNSGSHSVLAVPTVIADASVTGFNVTGSDGTFTLDNLPPDTYCVQILGGNGNKLAAKLVNVVTGDAASVTLATSDSEC